MLRILSLLVVVTLCLTACETVQMPWARSHSNTDLTLDDTGTDTSLTDPGLQMSTEQRFPDVPLPAKVKEDPERSFVYESSSLQVGRMVYETKSSVNDLAQFYIREAPAANWKLDRVLQANGAELLFTKPGKRLTVSIENLGLARGRRLTLLLVPDAGGAGSL